MIRFSNQSDTRVFFHFGKYPVGYALLFTILLTISMLVCAVVGPLRYSTWLMFSTTDPFLLSWWRVASHTFLVYPSFMGLIQLIFLGYFGHKLEQFMAERDFLILLGTLWLAAPLLAWAAIPIDHSSWQGASVLSFGLFLAFVCHAPNTPGYFGIPLKWFALVALVASILQNFALRMWPHLLVEGIIWYAVWWWMQHQGYALPWRLAADVGVAWPQSHRKKTKRPSIITQSTPKIRPRTTVALNAASAVDKILDKVNREGIHSLTEKERRLLQDTSDELNR